MTLLSMQYLMLAAEMQSQALTRLSRLQMTEPLDPQDLIKLYCYSLDLNPFDLGRQVVVYLLKQHKQYLAPRTPSLPQWLGSWKIVGVGAVFIATEETSYLLKRRL
jgi:hypothetical protein